MGLHHHRGRVFVDPAHLGALVQLAHHEGRTGPGVAQQRTTDVLLAHRILQPAGNNKVFTTRPHTRAVFGASCGM